MVVRGALGTTIASLILWTACGEPATTGGQALPGDAGHSDAIAPDGWPAGDAGGDGDGDGDDCPPLFSQDFVAEWRVTLSDSEWAALEDEFLNRLERDAADLELKPYHPVERITFNAGNGEVEVPNVLIRLKGQSSWVQAITYDENPKMQFVIAFNEIDPDGRFGGVRKVELDMPRTDWTFLRQRLALRIMRQAGQDAPCANSAKLYINGEYYGLYTHLERLDKEFLQRVYGKENGADDGDLWKSGSQIRTNEDSASKDRVRAMWSASSAEELGALADLGAAVHEWAAEAVLPHADGYHIGRHNYFLYDHPERGFLWLPHDLDTAFDYYHHELDLAFPPCSGRNYEHWVPYATALSDPAWMDRYVETVAEIRRGYQPEDHVAFLDEMVAQIAAAAAADPHRPFSLEDHEWALESTRDHLHLRAGFIEDWLECRRDGSGEDADGDGVVFCYDCDDTNASINPERTESCNGRDDDCDGFVDESCE